MSKLKTHFSYKKFNGASYRILYLNNNYFLQKESIAALKQLGHQVSVVTVGNDPSQMLDEILKNAIVIRPDCLLAVNHQGFDEGGKIAALLSQLRIPVAIWYLDDFRFIALKGNVHANSMTAIFTFERTHLPVIKAVGFEHVYHLPSATSIDPAKIYSNSRYNNLNKSVVFIGSTFNGSKKVRSDPSYPALVDKLKNSIDFKRLHINLVEKIRTEQGSQFSNQEVFNHYASYAMCEATQMYRAHILERVRACNFQVYGDWGWKNYNIKGTINGPVHNETVAPHIYHHALININISSQQLGTTVNLRVFDVPASGGFLLTDWKEELTDLFDVKNELVVYTHIEEMNERIAYYEKHPRKRDDIILKAHNRVAKEHLVMHRMQKMIDEISRLFG